MPVLGRGPVYELLFLALISIADIPADEGDEDCVIKLRHTVLDQTPEERKKN